MKRYDTYKDSGLNWIGDVPKHWGVLPLKYSLPFQVGFTPSTKVSEYYDNGTHDWVTIGDMDGKLIDNSKLKISDKAIKDVGKEITPKGSLLYSFKLSVGKVAFAAKDLYTNEAIFSILPANNINLDYYYYCLPSLLIHNANHNIYGAPIFNQNVIKNSKLTLPSPQEQTQIATYLDYKTGLIDSIIAQKEALIKKLKEQRQAIINEAVTKGLNKDVKLKDSGIEWLGEIPEHWEAAKLKWLSNIYSGGTPSTNIESYWTNGTIPWLNSGTVNQKRITKASEYITDVALQNSSTKWVNKGSILMALAGQGKTKGMAAMLEFDATCNQSMAAIEVDESKAYNEFILIWLESNYLNIRSMGGGEKRDGINLQILGNIYCPLPTLDEQKEIFKHVRNLTSKIEISSVELIKSIQKLKEYRQSLISEAVTGKIDVRDWQAPKS